MASKETELLNMLSSNKAERAHLLKMAVGICPIPARVERIKQLDQIIAGQRAQLARLRRRKR
jgi:hypothetical protein